MPSKPLYDLEKIDVGHVAVPCQEIEEINPQRFEFQQLTHVCHLDLEEEVIVGVRDVREDEFWVRGHMPDRPLFPGVLMLEAAAQLCGIYTARSVGLAAGTNGFGGADSVRFRRMVTIGDRLIIVAKAKIVHPSRSRYRTQGFVDGTLVFEARIFGLTLPDRR